MDASEPTRGERPFRVVITGGPCSGKTALWNFLGERCPRAVKVPETATGLILQGFTPQGMGLDAFQRMVFQRQLEAEDRSLSPGCFLLCDRGLADGLAYHPDLVSSIGLATEEFLGRYALVLHLQVIADREAYVLFSGNNPARFEDHAEALSLERRVARLYGAHPGYFLLRGSLEQKQARALEILGDRCRSS